MPVDVSFLAAFLLGVTGGVHCVGMCGGIVGALSLGLPESARGRTAALLPYLVAYNAGRLLSYPFAGALMGGLGAWAAGALAGVHDAQRVLLAVAGLFMVALGLYLGEWWRGLARVEDLGGHLWRHIEPLGRRWLPVRSPAQALLLGLVWGWLPCGLVYTVLIWSISAGGVRDGALLMLSFGVGTLPTLLAMGLFAAKLAALVRRPWARRAAGGVVVLFGIYTLGRAAGVA